MAGDWKVGGCHSIGWLLEDGLKFLMVPFGGNPALMNPPLLPGRQAATPSRVQASVVFPMEDVPAMNSSWKLLTEFGETPIGKAIVKLFSVALPPEPLGKWKLVSL